MNIPFIEVNQRDHTRMMSTPMRNWVVLGWLAERFLIWVVIFSWREISRVARLFNLDLMWNRRIFSVSLSFFERQDISFFIILYFRSSSIFEVDSIYSYIISSNLGTMISFSSLHPRQVSKDSVSLPISRTLSDSSEISSDVLSHSWRTLHAFSVVSYGVVLHSVSTLSGSSSDV